MADEVNIDKDVFHNHLSHLISAWKNDKRAGDAFFGGAGSLVILVGRNEASPTFGKNNALHVTLTSQLLSIYPELTVV